MSTTLTATTITVGLKSNPYRIYIGNNLLKKISTHIAKLKLGNFGIVITSPKIYSIYQKQIIKNFGPNKYKIIKVADGEAAKSKKWLFRVLDEIARCDNYKLSPFIICLGGGTVGDLGGFVAAIYKRGIPYIQIPTTLLAQIDSSIGGKTAIDMPHAKNIIGSFYQPKAVFIDPCFLATLPLAYFKEGLSEIVKYGVIKDAEFFRFLKVNHSKILKRDSVSIFKIVSVCARIKAQIVEKDEKETKGLRTVLNFGHTFAHALESALKYQKISHGEAVSLGMIYAGKLSLLLGKCNKTSFFELLDILRLFGLPIGIKFDPARIYRSLVHDKKFISGKIRMVLLKKIGKVEVVDSISPLDIKRAFKVFYPASH
ncbi:MAG: 3-dehydroquinate synthase [Candidatus Omnitrophica bacterium]|nr:3-dehydroquinate synthase [Candidatus Omnitrophota bacterium]